MSLPSITLWAQRLNPNPTERTLNVQIGCHLEEVAEMLDCIVGDRDRAELAVSQAYEAVVALATALKVGEYQVSIPKGLRADFLDSLADQGVTAASVAYNANMNLIEAQHRVDQSNWSKFVDGQPLYDENGKCAKGPNYQPVDLTGLY